MQITRSSILQVLSVAFLCNCLVLLTSANFFIYPTSDSISCHHQQEDEQTPLEEKSTSSSSIVIQEEYLHHTNCIPPVYYKKISTVYLISAAEQLPVVHFELISPPPKATI